MSFIPLGFLAASGAAAGDFESIATVTLGSATSTVTFSNIPTTYKHLQVRLLTNSDAGNQQIRLGNGSVDSAANYSFHYLTGQGSVAQGGSDYSINGGYLGYSVGSTYPFSAVADVLDYANTNKYKTIRSLGGQDVNGSAAYIMFTSSSWYSTSAANYLSIYNPSGNFAADSSFALYGITGA